MCHNISMKESGQAKTNVIEPEILDENGQLIAAAAEQAGPSAHGDVYGRVGFLTGFFALTFSVLMMLLGVLITIFVITPLLLLGRLLGLQIKKLHR